MTTNEAYELAMEKVNELRDSGIAVTIIPSRARDNADTIKKYSGPERVAPEKWNHVTFEVSDQGQSMRIRDARKYLGMCGIAFDTGGCSNCRDWELDWSFKYSGKEDEEWQKCLSENILEIEEDRHKTVMDFVKKLL